MTLFDYKTIKDQAQSEIIINKSRFIGNAFHVENETDAREKLLSLKKKYYDATHNCHAYILKNDGLELMRSSDDGEPSGTAGRPILDTVSGKGISDILLVVTRYFGGILLGTGGLVRAYSKSADETINNAKIISYVPGEAFEIVLSYEKYNCLSSFISENSIVVDTVFTDTVTITVNVEKPFCDIFIKSIIEKSCGTVRPQKMCELFIEKPL